MAVRRRLVRIGNSVGVTLPAALLREAGIEEGQIVVVAAHEGVISLQREAAVSDLLREWPALGASALSPATIVEALHAGRADR
jgi:antitoxin component of MazEF toxin-antitoxin module